MTPEEAKRRRHRNERIAATLLVLVLAAAVALFMVYNRREEERFRAERTYIPRHIRITPEVELLRTYLRFDTSNPPGNERPAAEWLAGILEQNGIDAEIIEPAPRRANVYARLKGKRPGEGLLLLHHIDVIPASPDGWTRPPFAAEIYFDQLYGRGALDMKATGICFLLAFLDVARSGRTPEHDIVFLAVADEETGSRYGMRWLLEHRPDVVAGVKYALNEGGITEMTKERLTYYGIEIGTKQVSTVLLEADSREQLRRARIALEPWFSPRYPMRVLPEVRSFFRHLAPHRIRYRDALQDINRTVAEGRFWYLPVGYRELAQNVLWADGVTAANGSFQMSTTLINLPDEDPDARLDWLREKVAPYGVRFGKILRKEGPYPISSENTPMFELLRQETERLYGVPVGTEILNKSFNDSRFLRKLGIEAYGINPFPVDYYQSQTIHSTDERIRIAYFNQGLEFARSVLNAYSFGK